MKIISEKIKQLYGTKAAFCEKEGHKYKDLASKIRTVQAKLDWLNVFLKPLGLKIITADETAKPWPKCTNYGDATPEEPQGLPGFSEEEQFPERFAVTPYSISLSRPTETPGWCLNRGGCADQYCRKQDSASACPVDSRVAKFFGVTDSCPRCGKAEGIETLGVRLRACRFCGARWELEKV